jgi:hypothetical protein
MGLKPDLQGSGLSLKLPGLRPRAGRGPRQGARPSCGIARICSPPHRWGFTFALPSLELRKNAPLIHNRFQARSRAPPHIDNTNTVIIIIALSRGTEPQPEPPTRRNPLSKTTLCVRASPCQSALECAAPPSASSGRLPPVVAHGRKAGGRPRHPGV